MVCCFVWKAVCCAMCIKCDRTAKITVFLKWRWKGSPIDFDTWLRRAQWQLLGWQSICPSMLCFDFARMSFVFAMSFQKSNIFSVCFFQIPSCVVSFCVSACSIEVTTHCFCPVPCIFPWMFVKLMNVCVHVCVRACICMLCTCPARACACMLVYRSKY